MCKVLVTRLESRLNSLSSASICIEILNTGVSNHSVPFGAGQALPHQMELNTNNLYELHLYLQVIFDNMTTLKRSIDGHSHLKQSSRMLIPVHITTL